MNAQERQKLIREASQLYYSSGTSPLSDTEFDALLEEERRENPNSPLLGVGHGYVLDQDTTPGEKIKHKYGTAGSLDKCHNYKELAASLKSAKKLSATLKLDGLSAVLYYKNGIMYQALTRGEQGIAGIDITKKIQIIEPSYSILKDTEFTGAVRGEILMSFAKFDEYSKSHSAVKTPRNTAAGLINGKELTDDLKYLEVVVYTVVGIEGTEMYMHDTTGETYQYRTPFNDYASMHEWLGENFGYTHVVYQDFLDGYDISEPKFMDSMAALRARFYGTYPADGIVLTDNEINIVNHSVIYNANAFKFKAESTETTITGIEWNLSKTKYLIPTLLVNSVQLSGTTVQRCTGNNAKYLVDNGLGIGAEIELLKSGEIIPKVERVIKPAACELPTKCPCCETDLIWDGVHLKCPNPDCKDSYIQDLLVWCNFIAPVEGLGDTLKIKFFEQLQENTIPDGNHAQFDISIEGVYAYNETISPKGAQEQLFFQMLCGLKNNQVSVISALRALNIPRLGEATADLLSHYKEDIDKLIEGVVPDNLAYRLGNANAEAIIKHKDKFKRLKFIYKNIQFSDNFPNNSRIRVAITGSLSVPRKQFEQLLNENGFVLGDINKDTKYLITDDPNSGSSKNAKADKLGVEKITEADFRVKYNL